MPMTIQVQIRRAGDKDVSLEDCARFSEPMGQAIEDSHLLKEAYVLEISSPGIGEQLQSDRDFNSFKGFPVEVTFKDENDSLKLRSGLLHERSPKHVHLNIKGRMQLIPRDEILGVRLTSPTG